MSMHIDGRGWLLDGDASNDLLDYLACLLGTGHTIEETVEAAQTVYVAQALTHGG